MDDFFPTSKWQRTYAGGKTALKLGARTVKYLSRKPFQSQDCKQTSRDAFDKESGEILFKGLSALKGTALKIAQMLSMELDIFPPAVRKELAKSCYQVPPINRALVRKIVTSNLGGTPETIFSSFDDKAFAAASLGQVHRAVAKTGEPLAVKVQYPGIDATIHNDIQMLKAVLFTFPEYHIIRPALQEIEERLLEETDYQQEGRNILFFKEHLDVDGVHVPVLFPETSGNHILSQGWLEGLPLNEWLAGNPSQEQRDIVANRLQAIFLHGLYELNCIHADPNPGNFLIGPNLTIGLVDYGCIKRFDLQFLKHYRKMPQTAREGSNRDVRDLLEGFDMLVPDIEEETWDKITGIFQEVGRWFDRLYVEEYFDFSANTDFIEEGKKLSNKSMEMSKYMKGVNTNFVFLNRTRYGLIRLFEMMQARVRMWNPYEWEGASNAPQ